ncbi:MAG TPA: hypothetical protein VMV71_00445 [Candidatus Paceibacterota bacterium]|nr:hypothetical protein [Candidatus Paceibacterota bacterium]
MPEIEDELKFSVGADKVRFVTRTNGDELLIRGIDLTQEQAATLAYLVNSEKDIEFEVREAETN